MTVEEKLKEIYSVFDKVLTLAEKNHCQVVKLRHKTLDLEAVLHILPEVNPAYELLSEIQNENLPKVYDTFKLSDGYLVLEEFISGLTVSEVAETGKYRTKGAVKVIKDICRAVSVLHDNGIIHRDIKPENIMITADGTVKLVDFNTARKMSIKSQDTVVMGTIGYASPEQLGLKQSDTRADIYALGVLLNEMLTGCHPTDEIAKGRYGKIVKKCTALNPDDRYQSALKLAEAL